MAGSCIGVILLVMALEALRRGSREYDAYIVGSFAATTTTSATSAGYSGVGVGAGGSNSESGEKDARVRIGAPAPCAPRRFKPTLLQQLVRAGLHMLQFAVAYFVMLLAMYFNGYIIVSILIGAFLGAFVFSWHGVELPGEQREITYCCG
ncbi:uncharacterized protein LTR77_004110 [Saxophila tyrrhenica]|uniref:Copper transport protein n=1 Tax=Saxophila tyrrhenica TaxID=1690608 RepID=A0AAV9PBV0_9PEZI|nr:hypothetical protein LTR77_004110 [Saxophila tyrrhenica]